jgi:hypothetical protein
LSVSLPAKIHTHNVYERAESEWIVNIGGDNLSTCHVVGNNASIIIAVYTGGGAVRDVMGSSFSLREGSARQKGGN